MSGDEPFGAVADRAAGTDGGAPTVTPSRP